MGSREGVEGLEQVALAEFLLVEGALDLPHAVALLDFLHEAHVILAKCPDDGVEASVGVAVRSLFVGVGQSEVLPAVFLVHGAEGGTETMEFK
jgi:hypothetical protein